MVPATAMAGSHSLIFALNKGGSPLDPAVERTVQITVEDLGPASITSATVDNMTIAAGGTFNITVTTENFQFDPQNYGGANRPGYGHYHVYLDQVGEDYLVAATANSPYAATMPLNATAGTHTLIVTLNNNDHSPVSPPVTPYEIPNIQVTPAPPPELSVTLDNDTIEVEGYFVATINASYFNLDPDRWGAGPNEDRYGGWRVYLDQVGDTYLLGGSALGQERIQIPAGTAVGAHTLYFTLNNNDYTPLTPPVEYTVDITVVDVPPVVGDNVVVQGNTTKLYAYLQGNTEYVGDAGLLVYGVNPVLNGVSDGAGAYSLEVPANGNAIIFSNKAGYNPSYNVVTTADQNIVGKKLYMAESQWITDIATAHNVDLAAPFACHAPALDPNINCIYTAVIGQIVDDGYEGNGEIRPVANITQNDFTITGGPAGAEWYTKGPYFLDYNGAPNAANTYSVRYQDPATNLYRGGLFVMFLEIPQFDGPAYVDFQISANYDDQDRGITRYFGPLDVKAFRPYGVSWTKLAETGVPIEPPLNNIDFDTQVYPLFLPVNQGGLGCQGCHTDQGGVVPAGGMNLYGADNAYNALDPNAYPIRVNLQDVAASYLLTKPLYELDGVQNHPIFAFASEQDIGYQIIYNWISEGAQRNVVIQPASFYNDIRPILYGQPGVDQYAAGCRTCHYDGVNNQNAPGGFFISNDGNELYNEMTNEAPNNPDPANLGYDEAYRINKDGYPERSLVLIKPLTGSNAVHPVKIFSDNADPRYVLINRWIVEGYQNDTP